MYQNKTHIISRFAQAKGQIAILIDPEKVMDANDLDELVKKAEFAKIDYFFIGGSTVTRKEMEIVVTALKQKTTIPLIIFPGSSHQLSNEADGILYLSLLSGRNPDYLIGHHVLAAQELHKSSLEILPTAYILIDGGKQSSVAYVSQTTPIPTEQEQIAVHTAIAGAMQGKKIIYFDAGSGALHPVPVSLLQKTANELPDHPIIVGGGIRSIEMVEKYQSLANVIVIGNHIEEHTDFLLDLAHFTSNRITSSNG